MALGLVCLLFGVGNTALSAFFLYRSSAVDAALAAYDAPVSRVLRGRRICRVGASELVRGDIILFYPGDMIPADCRLLISYDPQTDFLGLGNAAFVEGDESEIDKAVEAFYKRKRRFGGV